MRFYQSIATRCVVEYIGSVEKRNEMYVNKKMKKWYSTVTYNSDWQIQMHQHDWYIEWYTMAIIIQQHRMREWVSEFVRLNGPIGQRAPGSM